MCYILLRIPSGNSHTGCHLGLRTDGTQLYGLYGTGYWTGMRNAFPVTQGFPKLFCSGWVSKHANSTAQFTNIMELVISTQSSVHPQTKVSSLIVLKWSLKLVEMINTKYSQNTITQQKSQSVPPSSTSHLIHFVHQSFSTPSEPQCPSNHFGYSSRVTLNSLQQVNYSVWKEPGGVTQI